MTVACIAGGISKSRGGEGEETAERERGTRKETERAGGESEFTNTQAQSCFSTFLYFFCGYTVEPLITDTFGASFLSVVQRLSLLRR